MKKTTYQLVCENLHEFCKANKESLVFVGGMWCGDFIGQIASYGITEATFSVVKPLSDSAILKEYTFPFGSYLVLRKLTDEERQMDIAEVYGEVTIA